MLLETLFSRPSTDTSISDCLHLALGLVVALAKSYLLFIFPLEETTARASFFHDSPHGELSFDVYSQCLFLANLDLPAL